MAAALHPAMSIAAAKELHEMHARPGQGSKLLLHHPLGSPWQQLSQHADGSLSPRYGNLHACIACRTIAAIDMRVPM